MRESRADSARAFGLALLLHVALFALMFAGLWWTRSPVPQSAAGSPISAEMMDAGDLSPAMQRTLRQRPDPVPPEPEPQPLPEPVEEDAMPPPQPLPEPRPEDSPVTPQPQAQQQVPDPDTVDQDAARRDAISRETAEREQEAKRRQEQIDLTERLRQEEAEKRQRLAAQQREREEKLADLRKQQAQARREAALAEQKLKQIADQRAQQASAQQSTAGTPPPGNDGVDPGLGAAYAAAIQEAILSNWTRPENVPLGQKCVIHITQVRGGTVIKAEVAPSCPFDELGRRSVEAAVLKAQPLPYAGFESVFNRTVNLNFTAADR